MTDTGIKSLLLVRSERNEELEMEQQVKDMDLFIEELKNTRRQIQMNKVNFDKKSAEDILKDINKEKYTVDKPAMSGLLSNQTENRVNFYSALPITNDKKQTDYHNIMNKLKLQEEKIKKGNGTMEILIDPIEINKKLDEEESKKRGLELEKLAASIDNCIKLGEDLERYLDEIEENK